MLFAGSILFAFYAALVGIAISVWGGDIWVIVVPATVAFAGFQYLVGKKIALWSVGAEDLSPEQAPEIHDAVDQLCNDMDLEKPRVMVADMGVPNAFAVGRRGAGTVVISNELRRTLEFDELEGVIAHELAHISNRDVVMMVLGQSIASMVGIAVQWAIIMSGRRQLSDYFAGMIAGTIAQFLVMLFVLVISRSREYAADRDAAFYTGSGEPLASALEKISDANERSDEQLDDNVSALCIFGEGRGLLTRLFATHPPTEERIERLRSY
jgi:heat shock protein HtpX